MLQKPAFLIDLTCFMVDAVGSMALAACIFWAISRACLMLLSLTTDGLSLAAAAAGLAMDIIAAIMACKLPSLPKVFWNCCSSIACWRVSESTLTGVPSGPTAVI